MIIKEKVKAVIAKLNSEIKAAEKERLRAERARLGCFEFDNKNYFSGIESKYEAKIVLLNKTKNLIKKHFK